MTELKKIDQLNLRKFLATPSGVAIMLSLRERTPVIAKGQLHEVAYDGAFAAGYTKCLDTISEILGAEPKGNEDYENK